MGYLSPIVVFADKIIGGGKTPKIGHRFKAADKDIGWHGSYLILHCNCQGYRSPVRWLRTMIAIGNNDVSHSTALTDGNCFGVLR